MPSENRTLFRAACQASSSPHLRGFSVLILVVKDGLWKAKASKSCSLASGRIPKENPSAT